MESNRQESKEPNDARNLDPNLGHLASSTMNPRIDCEDNKERENRIDEVIEAVLKTVNAPTPSTSTHMESTGLAYNKRNADRTADPSFGQITGPTWNQGNGNNSSKNADQKQLSGHSFDRSHAPTSSKSSSPVACEEPSHPDIIIMEDNIESVGKPLPRVPMTPHIEWVRDNQAKIWEENPDCTLANFHKILMENWMKENPAEAHLMGKNRRKTPSPSVTAFELWCIKNQDKIPEQDLETAWNALTPNEKAKMNQERENLRRRLHYNNETKPFLCFCDYLRDTYKKKNEGLDDDGLKELMRNDWNALSENMRQAYRDASNQLTAMKETPKPVVGSKRPPESSENMRQAYRDASNQLTAMKETPKPVVGSKRPPESSENMRQAYRDASNQLTAMIETPKPVVGSKRPPESSENMRQAYRDASNQLTAMIETPKPVVGSKRPPESSASAKKPKNARKEMSEEDRMKKAESSVFFPVYVLLKKEDLVKNGKIIDKDEILRSWMRISINEKQKSQNKAFRIRKQYGMDKSVPISEVLSKMKHPLLTIALFPDASPSDISEEVLEDKWNALSEEERKQFGGKYRELELICKSKFGKHTKMYEEKNMNELFNTAKTRKVKHGRFEVFLKMEKEKFGNKFDETEACRIWSKMSEKERKPYTRRAANLQKQERKIQKRAGTFSDGRKKWKMPISEEKEEEDEEEEEEEEYDEMGDDYVELEEEEEEDIQYQSEPDYEPNCDQEPVEEMSSVAVEDPADISLYF